VFNREKGRSKNVYKFYQEEAEEDEGPPDEVRLWEDGFKDRSAYRILPYVTVHVRTFQQSRFSWVSGSGGGILLVNLGLPS
jgi:hypothetical protein